MLYLYSGQLPTISANFIPNNNGDQGSKKNYLLLGANSANKAAVVAMIGLNGQTTPAMVQTLSVGHYYVDSNGNNQYVVDDNSQANFQASVDGAYCTIQWVMADTQNNCEVTKYPMLFDDKNKNGVVDPNETVIPFANFPFHTVWQADYDSAVSSLSRDISGAYYVAGYYLTYSLFTTFLSGGQVPASDITAGTYLSPPGVDTILPNAFRLSHNVGIVWTVPTMNYYQNFPSGKINRWIIPATGDTNFYSWKALRHPDFVKMVSKEIAGHQKDPSVVAALADKTKTHTFTWALPIAVTFASGDMYYAVNNGTLVNMTATVTVANDGNTIQNVVLGGYMEDLYDFDFDQGGRIHTATIIQAGYPTLGSKAGAVFMMQMNFGKLDMATPNGPDGNGAGPFNGATLNKLPNYP